MTENPYAPSQASLADTIHADQVRPLPLSGGEIFSGAFRLMGENFWALCGIGILWYLITIFAVNSFVGLIAIPHLMAGLALAGYRFYRKQGALEHLFDGFQKFGPVLGFGLLLMVASFGMLILFAMIGGAMGAWAASTGLELEQLFEAELPMAVGGTIIAVLLMIYVYHYLAGRLILVFPLIVYFQHGIGSAFSVSWKATSASAHAIALQHMLFDFVFYFLGFLLLCIGVVPAFGLMIAFRGAVCGPLLDHLYPEGAPLLSPVARQPIGPPATAQQTSATDAQPPSGQTSPPTTTNTDTPIPRDDDRFKPPSFPSGPNPYS
jgi:hypothetical protein